MNQPDFRSLTYVSRPAQPFSDLDFAQLGIQAARLNALDGITGLLVFNGQRFCQTIEGGSDAIDHLLDRLRRDPRHEDLQIVADGPTNLRRFRSWDMHLLAVPNDRDAAMTLAAERLDCDLDVAARAQVYATVEGVFA
jgi:hypothetical protein